MSSRAATKAGPALRSGAGLESSEAVFRALAAHTPLGIFVSDVDGRCLYVNDRWCELAGMTAAEALGDGWASAIHPDDAERLLAEWADASRADRDSTVEYRFQRPDGGVSWIQGFASALRDDGGHVTGWVGSCLDTTTRRRAEEAAAESGVRFQVAFDSAPNGVALTAPDGSWLDVNYALCKLTGYSKDELLARPFAEITHPDDRALSHAGWIRHTTGATDSNSIEKRYIRAGGTIVWVAVSRMLVRERRRTAALHRRPHRGHHRSPGGPALACRGRGALSACHRRRTDWHGARGARRALAQDERVALRDPGLLRTGNARAELPGADAPG